MADAVRSPARHIETREGIDAQARRLADLPPGTPQHRSAEKVLRLLEDLLRLLLRVDELLAAKGAGGGPA